MKVKEITRRLNDDGWRMQRRKGSHRQFKHPAKRGLVTVPGTPNDDWAPGTVSSIFKQAGWKQGTAMKYAVVIEKATSNDSAYVPDLPGCVATGATVEQTEQEIRTAIKFHLEGLKREGLEIPLPSSSVDYVEVAA